MTPEEFHNLRKTVETPSGRIAYIEKGEGPAALFVHGVPLNGYHWRFALEGLSDLRRCIAPDLMGLGYSEVGPDQPLDFDAQARMLLQFLDALGVETIDLIGNDSGGAVAQILATNAPGRIRSLTLTNCDTHDNWPPEAFLPIVNLGKAGHFGHALAGLLADPRAARSPQGLGVGFEFPGRLTDEVLAVYLTPVTATEERRAQVSRYVAVQDCAQTVRIEDRLKTFDKPTLIVWGDSDVFFPAPWAHWLAQTIPGTRKVEILEGATLFFPEERPDIFCRLVRDHWHPPKLEAPSMPTEILMLVLTGLLSLVVAVLTIAIHFRAYGGKMIRGNRDDFPRLQGVAMRVVRAHANLNEALLPFAIIVITAAVLHVSTPLTVYSAIAFFTARMAHAVLYLAGATPWRSISYYGGLIATIVFAAQLPFAG